MKVFASQFLETMDYDKEKIEWSWKPANDAAYDIYASGAPTKTKSHTYADERDTMGDTDRPNEGLIAV